MSTTLSRIVKTLPFAVFVLAGANVASTARAESYSFAVTPYRPGFAHPGWVGPWAGFAPPGYGPYVGFIPHPYDYPPFRPGGRVGPIYGPRPFVVVPWRRPYSRERSAYPPADAVAPAGRLVVNVRPEHAVVLVDGYPLGPGGQNAYEIGLLVGEHRVEARAPGHDDYRGSLVVEKGRRHVVDISLSAH